MEGLSDKMEQICYPRVLIVNQQSMSKRNATGITLKSLWGEWPSESAHEIFTEPVQEEICQFESKCIHQTILQKISRSNVASSVNSSVKKNTSSLASKGSLKTVIRQGLVMGLDSQTIHLSKKEWKQIELFKPEVIYTLGASVSILNLVHTISERLNTPIVIHFMDNWPEHLQWENNPLCKLYHKRMLKCLNLCLQKSNVGIAISPIMAREYQKKFEIEFGYLMNSVDQKSFLCKKINREMNNYVYAGGLHLLRWKALKDIACAIKSNSKAQLSIYTSEENQKMYEEEFKGLPVVFYNFVDHEKIKDVYESADVLVHTEVDNPLLSGFFKYSISTKVPEYLSTGKPMLFFGPKSIGLFQYLQENKAAFVASTTEELNGCILKMQNEDLRCAIVNNALKLARINHSMQQAHNHLRSLITQACM